MKTAIITDTNSGIHPEEARQLGIFVVPMPVILEGKTYYEGVDLSPQDFFAALERHADLTTSQPMPQSLIEVWDQAFDAGYDEAVYFPMSSGLSSSYTVSHALAETQYQGRVWVADAKRISVTMRAAVNDCLKMVRAGKTAAQICDWLEKTANNTHSYIYLGVEDMTYLRRGGRITPATAALAGVLNIKPLMLIDGERLDAFAKVRSIKKCREREVQAAKEMADHYISQGHAVTVRAAGSFAREADAEAWRAQMAAAFPDLEVGYDPLGFSIGCHVGPNAFGVGISVTDDLELE